ncbi:MAG: M3 family metallopeptidase [Rhodobacteraceae bacterium]|nr:M3 family metallopeptidase [Paracoccaceae bacterium]
MRKTDKSLNPLLRSWETPHKIAPFSIINDEHFEPALEIACSETLIEIEQITENNHAPTFENTIEALFKTGQLLDQVISTFYTIAGAHTNEKRDQLLLVFSTKLSDHNTKIYSNTELFERIDSVVETKKLQNLNNEQARVLMLVHRNFIRSGAALKGENREKFQTITRKLAEIGTKFSQNLLSDERDWFMKLDNKKLETLPSFLVQALNQAGKDRGINQAVLTLSRSLITPFLQFCSDRALRELAYVAWTKRGAHEGDRNNVKLAHETLKLRAQMAKILGYASYSHYKLDTEMASSPENVDKLLTTVWDLARKVAIKDEAILSSLMRQDGIGDTLRAWDWRFYAERRRLRDYDLNEETVKPFFQLDNLINATFKCASELFDLEFSPLDAPLYHDDCRAWTVSRKGENIAVFIGDYFSRPSKRSGAWCNAMRSQAKFPTKQIPIVVNVCNFSKVDNFLLSFEDAKTLFHEFGHALHQILSDVTYNIISGTSVARDFVELPSQLFEHWLEVPDILEEFATHCETGETLPPKMLSSILAASTFDMGFQTTEYLASAFVDLYLHREETPDDIMERQDQILQKLKVPRSIGMRHAIPHFAHIFSGSGYASGYYSYMWSEVMDCDAFAAFMEAKNPFDREVAQSLEKNILAAGGSEEPAILYTKFRGRLPDPSAMIKARGLEE